MEFKKINIYLIIIILSSSFLFVNLTYDNESDDLVLVSDVKYISKEIGPRPAGSENEKKAAQYLALNFKMYGVETQIDEFYYYSMHSKSIKKSENVIGTIKGISSKQIIICADLDTYYDKKNGNYVEGANDDATSLALLIGLAKKYQNKKPYFTIKLIGFGAGEDEYTIPINTSPRTSLNETEYNKIMSIPYLIGARHYVLQNQDSIKDIVAVISLEAVGTGDPCFIAQDSYVYNNQSFVDFLASDITNNGFKSQKVDFMTYTTFSGDELPISHIYLPFSYANVPATFLTCMKSPNVSTSVHGDNEMPDYLTVNDTYENLVKNNGGEENLQKHLDEMLCLTERSIDKIHLFYALNNSFII